MTSPLVELFRHNKWANESLLHCCAGLSDEQLTLRAPGTFGTVRDTLVHLVGAEQRYLAALSAQDGLPVLERGDCPGIAALRESARATGDALIRFAEVGLPSEEVTRVRDGKTWHIAPAHFLVQAINHATEHRAHVVSILTQNGIAVPDLDGWAYSSSVGLIRTE